MSIQETSKDQSMALLVLSCDKNKDLWHPFFSFLNKYWIDCPYEIYLSTNYLKADEPFVITKNSSQISDWSSELIAVLHQIAQPNVLIMLEDYFIYQKVETTKVRQALELMIRKKATFMMLACFPSKYKSIWKYKVLEDAPDYGVINKESDYLVNLQTGIWNKQTLLDILVNGESPWQFELEASKRFAKTGQIALCVREEMNKNYVHGPVTYFCGALTKGVVMRDAIRLCKRENISFIVEGKKIESRFEEISRRFYIGLPMPLRKALGYFKVFANKVSGN